MTPLTHIPHLENLFLERGIDGFHDAMDQIWGMKFIIEGRPNNYLLSTKYDGAPSIVMGIHPETNKFFVGTKSVFNQNNPKICYDHKDITDHYPEASSDLIDTLDTCLIYGAKLGIQSILQGDVMYLHNVGSDSSPIIENGMIKFTPNITTYGVPLDTDLGQRILNSRIGIIFHTEYDKDWSRMPSPNLSNLNYNTDVWFRDASFTMTNPAYVCSDDVLFDLEDLLKCLSPSFTNRFFVNKKINALTNLFFNDIIRNKTYIENGWDFVDQFSSFIHNKMNDEIDNAVKNETKLRKLEEKTEILQFILKNRYMSSLLFRIILDIVSIKHMMIDVLNQNDSALRPLNVNHEGYVMSDLNNRLTKWVNRREFSARNFASNKWSV